MTRHRVIRLSTLGMGALAGAAAVYRAVARGQLTADTGVGRRTRDLGPLSVLIAAPRETVFDVIAAPYLARTPRALAGAMEVVEQGSDMVLALHRTSVSPRLVASTLETVRFERPETVSFRLVRGPVPFVVEQFILTARGSATLLEYRGEMGTDFWRLGSWWGDQVAPRWEAEVRGTFDAVAIESERRAGADNRAAAAT